MLPTPKKPAYEARRLIYGRCYLAICLLLAPMITGAVNLAEQVTLERGTAALTQAYAGMDDSAIDQFALGKSLFHIPWVAAPASTSARDGLGPLYNANSCASCHAALGGGEAVVGAGPVDRSIVIRLQRQSRKLDGTDQQLRFNPDPVYGAQLSINANSGITFEGQVSARSSKIRQFYADGDSILLAKPEFNLAQLNYGPLADDTRLDALMAPRLIGLGLVELIPDQQILRHEDELDEDSDGISGRAARVWSELYGEYRLGRFGRKAGTASVIEQVAQAMSSDMGLTSPWHPKENCGDAQSACLLAVRDSQLDVPMPRLQAIAFYLRHLRLPQSASDHGQRGRRLFNGLGCEGCHSNHFRLENGLEPQPFSDFLLHDMGPDLMAESDSPMAQAQEWKTTPLWGLGLSKIINPAAGYLHDGRADSIEQAIVWHGGEAAASRQAFMQLSRQARQHLLNFLESL